MKEPFDKFQIASKGYRKTFNNMRITSDFRTNFHWERIKTKQNKTKRNDNTTQQNTIQQNLFAPD